MGGEAHLGDEVDERLSSQLVDALLVQTGQVVELGLPLCLAAGVERAIL